MEKQAFNADETGLFYKNVGKWIYVTQTASKTPGLNHAKTMQPCYYVPMPRSANP